MSTTVAPARAASMLDVTPRHGLAQFVSLCAATLPGIDARRIGAVAQATVRYLGASKSDRTLLAAQQQLQQRWYDSLRRGEPDWGVYDDDLYLAELWACWVVYSRRYLLDVRKRHIVADPGRVRGVLDLGCGFGYTTAALREIFPRASVVGTNLDNTRQMTLARAVAERFGVRIVSDVVEAEQPVDLVFASEYFEHIPDPVEDLQRVLRLRPALLLIANTFTSPSIGHFPSYRVHGRSYDGKTTSRLFNEALRRSGYEKCKTSLWNNRPAVWRRL